MLHAIIFILSGNILPEKDITQGRQYMSKYCLIFVAYAMKKTIGIIISFLFLFSLQVTASHIFGGELYYRHLNGLTYEVNLALYGDCGGQVFPNLNTLVARVDVRGGTAPVAPLYLVLDTNTRDEITPVCPAYRDSTQCENPFSAIYGITRFVYRDTVTLPGIASDYKFVFDGAYSNAGRTNNISNIVISGASIIYLEAELDNTEPNSSPQFTSVPTPFYCVNMEQEYNQGAVDNDSDSLVFELAHALNQGGGKVLYVPGYSADVPVETGGEFAFNPLNGQVAFTPVVTQRSVVVNKVYEYRNGKVVGTTMREMTFIVIGNCNNIPAKGQVDSVSTRGGIWSAGNVLNVCTGTGDVHFVYKMSDPDGDPIEITSAGVPQGSELIVRGNNTAAPVVEFTWNAASLRPGNYTFFLTARDEHCPVSAIQTRGFTIRITDPYEATHSVIRPTNCYHKATLLFDIAHGLQPATCSFLWNDILLRRFTDTVMQFTDSFSAGAYVLVVSSPFLPCSTVYNFQVTDSGIFPFAPVLADSILCFGSVPNPLRVLKYPGADVLWYDVDGNILPEAPMPATSSYVPQHWLVAQQVGTCRSEQKNVEVSVVPNPRLTLLFDTGTVCMGEKVYLNAAGAPFLKWLPEGSVFREPDNTPFLRIYESAGFSVIGSNEKGCSDTIEFEYRTPEPCCTFSYPTAFTPNGDGRNDYWRPVMYGNYQTYELCIYNRWGTRIFHSFLPNDGWDGTYLQELQPMDTYHYYLKARCVTGKDEMSKGAFTLIR